MVSDSQSEPITCVLPVRRPGLQALSLCVLAVVGQRLRRNALDMLGQPVEQVTQYALALARRRGVYGASQQVCPADDAGGPGDREGNRLECTDSDAQSDPEPDSASTATQHAAEELSGKAAEPFLDSNTRPTVVARDRDLERTLTARRAGLPREGPPESAGLAVSPRRLLDVRHEKREVFLGNFAAQRPIELDGQGRSQKVGRFSRIEPRAALVDFGRGAAQVAWIDSSFGGDLLQFWQSEPTAFRPGGWLLALQLGRALQDEADLLVAVATPLWWLPGHSRKSTCAPMLLPWRRRHGFGCVTGLAVLSVVSYRGPGAVSVLCRRPRQGHDDIDGHTPNSVTTGFIAPDANVVA